MAKKVTVVTTKSCPYCPSAKRVWQEVKKEHSFEYEEVDAMSPEGQDLVGRLGVMTVPTTIINGKIAFTGVPDKKKAIQAVE